MSIQPITSASCIVRGTGARPGRSWWVVPGETASRHLHYGRVRLQPSDGTLTVDPGGLETGLVAL